jgi:hypothetical protein
MNAQKLTRSCRAAILALLLGTLVAYGSTGAAAEMARVEDLRCEYCTAAVGIDAVSPRLSWLTRSDQRGWRQTAYQILVASCKEKLERDLGDLWDSDRTVSDQSIHVAYQGLPLKSSIRYWWKVRVWDQDGQPSAWSTPSVWTMGLLKPDDSKSIAYRVRKRRVVDGGHDSVQTTLPGLGRFTSCCRSTHNPIG